MVNMVGVTTTLNNNCSLRVDPDAEVVYVNVPRLEGDNVYFNTNSSFSKIEKIVDYKWPKTRNINWLTVHQTKPFIAYVIHNDFQDSCRLSRSIEELDPQKQAVRIFNYHTQKRSLLKPSFSTTIADLAFAYVSTPSRNGDRLAVADRFANFVIYGFSIEEGTQLIHSSEMLRIVSEVGVPFSEVRLAWCPGYIVDDEDFGMNMAISYDNVIEVYDVGRYIEKGFRHISKEELELSSPERKLIKESGCEPIITLALSNDLAMICSASKDNKVRFYQLEDEEARLVHTWEPKWSTDSSLSCIFFLDDFNQLLKDQDSGIWGYILVGTSNGEITIWESNLWRPIQKVVLCFQEGAPSNITYRIDLTSHVIIAIKEKTGFLLHLEFLDVENCSLGSDEKPLLVKQPRIKKITRFQLYNPILSFTIKRPNPSQIEIFWLTQKTIEKCLVDVESLVVDENVENTFLSRYSISNINQDYDQKRSSLLYQNMSINGGDDESNGNDSSRRSLPSFEATPPVSLADIFNNISTISESGTSGLIGVGGSGNKSSSSEIKSMTGQMSNSMIQRPTSSPTSREVANYLDDEKLHSRNQTINSFENIMRMEPQSEMDVTAKILNIDPRVHHPINSVPYEPLPKDLVKESMIKSLETNLIDNFDLKMESIKSEMFKITNDLESLRNEVKDPSQLKSANKIVDALIKKLMHQMNGMFAKGLDEFVHQIRSEITPTINSINQCRNDLNTHCSSVEKQFKQCETQITELRKELTQCCKTQADILVQLKIQQQQIHSAVSPSPTALRHQLMNVTPTPGKQPFSPMVIFQSEEEKRKKAEQERERRLKQMWSKIRSNDKQLMIEGICSAFDLKDPALINQICEYFRDTKGASFLVELIAHDQALLLSILNNLASADLKAEKWKIPFITSIIPKLESQSSLVSDWLPRFETKLIHRLDEAHKALGDEARDIPLVLKILALMRSR